ncbi:hypothetical protein CVS54_01544 [Microbacterium oxydans]|uniref:DUF58 domain-containing protein n=1 Tax=Microbacterium oxydans TaxID=82380 RepID=A0A3S9WJH2_9MICO|nr:MULTISPECIES: DUF58 domain-containing protein [Microbacterium]AZS40220.1 hypothetical protein CVS54_01544 [Microbacterium oxydans]
MTESVRVTARSHVRWSRTPVIAIGLAGSAIVAAAGLVFSRPDVVGIGLPLALATVWVLLRRPCDGVLSIELRARPEGFAPSSDVVGAVGADLDTGWLQVAVDQEERRSGVADVLPGRSILTSRNRLQHSGPVELLGVTARGVALDGAWVSEPAPRVALEWHAPPRQERIGQLPVAPRLTGLHGAHEGSRPGQGGEFRDIHPFAPGDELRRVDWRATARAARRPGDLLVRRTVALSDSSVVIAIDTAEDLGTVVASWGTDDADRSGVTSLDHAREAALSIATAAIGVGDRVSYHALSPGGRSLPAGGGPRHLARLRDVIAATGQSEGDPRYRRSPVVPPGSIIFVLSTFFDGAAAQLVTRWRASGHAVVAVDVLPAPEESRLTREQRIALRTLLAERSDILVELEHAGVEVVRWTDSDADVAMRLAALRQQRMRMVRR